jgi:hypothetical protein
MIDLPDQGNGQYGKKAALPTVAPAARPEYHVP